MELLKICYFQYQPQVNSIQSASILEFELGMHEGWETARNPTRPAIFETGMDGMLVIPGCHYAIIRLAGSMKCTGVIVETKHYKGNYPESCSIEGGIMVNNVFQGMHLSRRFKLYADARYGLGKYPQISDDIMNIGDIEDCGSITHVKIYMYPDGGISRLRIYGILD